jgi:hypothetical protein
MQGGSGRLPCPDLSVYCMYRVRAVRWHVYVSALGRVHRTRSPSVPLCCNAWAASVDSSMHVPAALRGCAYC